MKKLNFIIFPVLLLGLLAALPVYGQTRVILKGDIPFDFTVSNKLLRAGAYDILGTSVYPIALTIRGSENLEYATFTTISNEKSRQVKPMFVFRRYGNQYFLAQLWTGSNTGRELPKSSEELRVAKNQAAPELIYVAAK